MLGPCRPQALVWPVCQNIVEKQLLQTEGTGKPRAGAFGTVADGQYIPVFRPAGDLRTGFLLRGDDDFLLERFNKNTPSVCRESHEVSPFKEDCPGEPDS